MPFTFHINPDDSARSLRRRKESPLEVKTLDGQEVKGLGMRIAKERFDPKAFDGDGDGLVQDASEFERPSVPLNVGIPYGLRSVTGDYSGRGYANLTPKEVAEKAVPDSPQRFVEQLLQHKRRDDLTNAQYLESFSKDLLDNLGSTEPFDFSPQAVKVLRVALEKALTDSPSFHDEVGRFGMPPVVMFKKGAMTRLVGAAYEYEHNWMSFNPNTFSTGAIQNIKKRMNTSKFFVNGFGAKGTKKQLAGVEVSDYFRHEFGHYLNDIALETAPLGSRQMALASYYALDDWESTEFLMNTLGIDDEELKRLSGQWKDLVDAIENNKDMPDGAPFVGTQYGQTNPSEMFAEGVSAYLSDDEDIHNLLNPVLKAHIQEVLGHPIRTVTPRKRAEERNAIGLRSSQKPTTPTGGNVQMPSFFLTPNLSDPNNPYETRHTNIGIAPTSPDWLKDASDDEIAELVVVRSAMDWATYIAQLAIGEDWNKLSRAEQHMESQAMLPHTLTLLQADGIDFSPEGIKEAQDIVREALKDPAFAWYVRTFGLPPITVTTSKSASEARLRGNVTGTIGGAPGESQAGAWFRPLGEELTSGITFNLELRDYLKKYKPDSKPGEITLWKVFQNADEELNLPWGVQGDMSSTLRHEYGHFLYWKLTRRSARTQLQTLGMTESQILANKAELRDLFNAKKGWALGDPLVSKPISSMYDSVTRGRLVENKHFDPFHFFDLAGQGYPVVFSGYALSDPQETFAEGFAAVTSPHANVNNMLVSDAFRSTLARLSGITVTGETRGKHTSTGGTPDKPWERNVSGLASRSATIMGKDFGQISKELELSDKEVSIAEDELTQRMDEVTSGELAKRPIHSAIEQFKKRLLDSIRVEVDDDGIPMMMADPNPLMFQFIPDKRDWSKVRVPKRATVKAAAKHIKENQSEAIFNDEDTRQSLFGRNYERLEERFSNRLIGLVESLTEGAPKEDIGDSVGSGWLSLYLSGLSNPIRSSFADGSGSVESGVHDAFGHAGIGRGFDRHGEWANPLAVITMLDNPIFDDFTPDEKEAVKRSVLTRFAMSRIEQTYGTGFGDKYDEDMDGGQWNNWIYGYTGDIQTVIDMLDDSDRTQVLNNDGSPISGLRSGKPLNGATRTDVQAVAKQDAIHTHGLASQQAAIEVIDALVKDPSLYDLAPEKIPEVIFKLAGGDPELFSRMRNRNVTPQGMWTEERIRELVNQIRIEPSPDGIFTMIAPPVPEFQKIIGFDGDFSHVRIPSSEARIRMYQSILDNLREPTPGLGYTDYSETFGEKLSDAADSLLISRSAYNNLRESLGAEYTPGGSMDSFDTLYERFLRVPSDAMMIQEQDQGSYIQVMHDIIGHLGTGRGFDRHGEWANFLAMVHTSQNIYADNPEYKDALPFDLFRRIMIMQLRTWEEADEKRGISTAKEALRLLEKIHKASDNMTIDVETMRQILQLDNPDTYSPVQNKSLLQEPPKTRATAYIHSLIDNNITKTRKAHSSFVGYVRGKPIKQPDTKTLPWVAVVTKSFLDNAPQQKSLEQDSPELWKEMRKNILKGEDGGKAGEWTARKQQILIKMYKDAGGGFRGTLRSTNRSIKRWSRERYARSQETSNGSRRYSDAGINGISNRSQAKKNKRTVIGRSRSDKESTKRKPRTMGKNLRGS